MRRTILVATAIALVACNTNSGIGSSTVSSSSTNDPDNVSSSPQVLTYFGRYTSDPLGQIELTGILDIKAFDTVNLEIVAGYPDQARNLRIQVVMGKITGTTLAKVIDGFTLDFRRFGLHIHTYDVIRPELIVWILDAPPSTDVDVQAWVFLR